MRLLTGFIFSSIAVIDGDTIHLTVPGTDKPVKVPAASHCPNQGVSK